MYLIYTFLGNIYISSSVGSHFPYWLTFLLLLRQTTLFCFASKSVRISMPIQEFLLKPVMALCKIPVFTVALFIFDWSLERAVARESTFRTY
jgi:hypothetical protein